MVDGVKVSSNQLSSEEVEIDEISGRRLLMEFKAFGYYKRTCQLELRKNGDCVFSKGMVARENGAWRVEVSGHYYRLCLFSWRYICYSGKHKGNNILGMMCETQCLVYQSFF